MGYPAGVESRLLLTTQRLQLAPQASKVGSLTDSFWKHASVSWLNTSADPCMILSRLSCWIAACTSCCRNRIRKRVVVLSALPSGVSSRPRCSNCSGSRSSMFCRQRWSLQFSFS